MELGSPALVRKSMHVDKPHICDLLKIQFPILQGAMLWIADAHLASSVSNAGALGTLSPYAGMQEDGNSIENLQFQISRTRKLTSNPFAVNIPLDLPDSGLLADLVIAAEIPIVVTSAGSPQLYTDLFHSVGIRVLHVVSSVKQALFAQSCCVDAIIAEGSEAGGRIGRSEIPLLSLIPQIAREISIPVIAAGGIVDTHQLLAALALGADGVQLGTRFLASTECIAHPNYKNAILEAGKTDTLVTGRRINEPARRLKSNFSLALFAMEQSEASQEELRTFIGRGRSRKAQIDGNLDEGDFLASASSEFIDDIIPAARIMENLIKYLPIRYCS